MNEPLLLLERLKEVDHVVLVISRSGGACEFIYVWNMLPASGALRLVDGQ
jgi:hypothetical protein